MCNCSTALPERKKEIREKWLIIEYRCKQQHSQLICSIKNTSQNTINMERVFVSSDFNIREYLWTLTVFLMFVDVRDRWSCLLHVRWSLGKFHFTRWVGTGSRLWNSLPTDVTPATTLPVFCSRLKTYLFSVSFPAWFVLYNLHSFSAFAVCINLKHLEYF